MVVGAIDKRRTARRIEELFGDLPRADERATAIREPLPPGERRVTMRTPHSVTRLCIGFPTCRMGERDDYALDLIAHDLGNSKNSRLYRRLVLKDRTVGDISVINETRQDPGGFFLLAELHPGADRGKVEAAIREEVAALVAEGVAERDLRRIRTQIRSSFLFQDETVLDMAMKLARFEAGTPDGYRTLADVLPTYDALKRRDLKEVAARYLDFDRATVVWAVPANEAASKPAPRKRRTATAKATKKRAKKASPKKAGGKRGSKKKAGRKKS